jgi:hypothetical protein
MVRIAISSVEKSALGALTAESQTQLRGSIQTKPVLNGEDRPIWLFHHQAAANSELQWDAPDQGHCVFVQSGSAQIEGRQAVAGDAVFVEHGARATLRVGAEGAELLHFHSTKREPAPELSGGHVHVVGERAETPFQVYESTVKPPEGRSVGRTLQFLKADCPNCTLYLHRSQRDYPNHTKSHSHNANEIIVLMRGEMNLGKTRLTPGAAIAVDQDTRYAFITGDDGIDFLNFRPAASVLTKYGEKGEVLSVGGGE